MSKILIGLDIGTNIIKAVQVSSDKNKYALLAAGLIKTPPGVLTSTNIQDEHILSSAINRLVHDMKVSTTEVSASLPSPRVVTRVIQIPLMSESELESSIQWEAEQYIPLPLSKVKLDYAIINKDDSSKKMEILMVAASTSLIEKYMRIITQAGLNPVSLETEILAITRTVLVNFPTLSNVIIMSIGASSTEIALIHDHLLVYTKSFPIGGITLTRAISQELGFETAQAEEYMRTYGLEEDKLEGKIARIINPFFGNILSEMEKTITYFKEKYTQEEIGTTVICGGLSNLPGLVMTVTKNLGIDSQICNPFGSLQVDKNIMPILSADSCLYTTAIGLALKDI